MSFTNMATNPLWLNGLLFSLAAVTVWMAGTRLSVLGDAIADRTGMGRAFTGLLLLATATSLPEIATTGTAAVLGNAPLLTSNIFGGIAMQTAVLSVVDLSTVRGALTYVAPRPVLLIQGVLLCLMLAAAIAITVIGEPLAVLDVGLGSVLLFVLYVGFLYASKQYQNEPRWRPTDEAEMDVGPSDTTEAQKRLRPLSNRAVYLRFAGFAAGVAVAGWMVAQSADALAHQTGISSSLVGAILVAIATSLPEVSTTFSAVKMKAYGMAISNIFGSNALMLALAFPGDILYSGILLRQIESSTIFLLPLGIMVTCLYLWGILERRDRTIWRMGVDSFLVLFTYIAGIVAMALSLSAGSAH